MWGINVLTDFTDKNKRKILKFLAITTGRLKMREWKMRYGQKMQGWKMHE